MPKVWPKWVLIELRTGRKLATASFGRLPALIDVAVEIGRAFLDPDKGVVRLSPGANIQLRAR
jgi:hypothetical protein